MKILLICFSLLVILLIGWLFLPVEESPQSNQITTETDIAFDKVTENQNTAVQKDEMDLRYETMRAEYQNIEKLRRDLNRRLSQLKLVLWDQKLPKQQAEEMQLELMNAYALLKNPKLLGSFHDVHSLQQETEKLHYALVQVQKAIDTLRDIDQAQTAGRG